MYAYIIILLIYPSSHQMMSTTSSQSLSSTVTGIAANIEGLSAVKASILSDVCKEQYCHCLCLQETHRGARKSRLRSPRMTLVPERPTANMGALFSSKTSEGEEYFVTAANHVEGITAELPDVVVHSVYKPPNEQFVLHPLGHGSLPQIVIGEFTRQNTKGAALVSKVRAQNLWVHAMGSAM